MKKLLVIPLILAAFSAAYANCPGQYFPDTGICQIRGNNGEIINYNVGLPGGGRTASPQQRVRTIEIPDSWGGISVYNSKGYIYSATDMPSERAAKKEALRLCKNENGAKAQCTINLLYANACATGASGKNNDGTYTASFASGETPSQGENAALLKCRKEGRKNCQIIMPIQCSFHPNHPNRPK